ncbi:nucleotide exchange factor GrpE [Candidatus Shapirobacteria bacterium]|nr:nucleotide exchange factor GrpE [Candidatus Shapirobacteria bacterium]
MKKNKPAGIKPDQNVQKIIELEDKLNRSLADYINLEKRIEGQRQFFTTLATTSIITKMIDVLDDLLLAQTHLNDQGLAMTISKFKNTLIVEGLTEINPQDQVFDHNTMECISTTEGEADKVISVHKIGYSLNGQTLRPAQVIVGKPTQNN